MKSRDLPPPPWRAPSWWDVSSNVIDASNRRLISNAYAKAEKCRRCRNFSWPPQGVEHSVRDWQLTAEQGCAGCIVLCSIAALLCYHVGEIDRPDHVKMRFILAPSRIMVKVKRGSHFEVYSPNTHNHAWKIPHLPREFQVSSYSGSAHAIKRTQLWLRQCDETHGLCSHTPSPLPSRVILIQGPQNVKLYESNGETVPYACLSHCWGKKQIIRTTTSTLSRHTQSIPWSRLPLTFQQAVSFTYRLGLRYLWIDSLCIIQDDVDDWRHEGSKMAQIYSGAYITLAATASRDASYGCFRHTPERPLFRLSYPDEQGSKLDLCIRTPVENRAWYRSHAPLLSRAWILQERLLSPRTLHFTHEELIWECRTMNDCECSLPRPEAIMVQNFCNSAWLSTWLAKKDDKMKTIAWWSIVQQYSRQRLTYEKDIFPALQGISRMFSNYKKSRYLAGLWEDTLVQELSWMKEHHRASASTGLKAWRAPSWSWASILGPVSWGNYEETIFYTPYATCTAIDIKLAGPDEFGEILSGTITLRSRCFPQAIQQSWIYFADGPGAMIQTLYPDDPVWRTFDAEIYINPDLRSTGLDAKTPHPDNLIGSLTCYKTVLLTQTCSSDSKNSYFTCLVLRRCHDNRNNTYERVAYADVTAKGCVDASQFPLDQEETLCII